MNEEESGSDPAGRLHRRAASPRLSADGKIVAVVPQAAVFEVAYVVQSQYNVTSDRRRKVGGLQTYERDLATWLIARGQSVVVYSTRLGDAERQFALRTIPVTDDLRSITAPVDVIHGDSALETMTALLQFPG